MPAVRVAVARRRVLHRPTVVESGHELAPLVRAHARLEATRRRRGGIVEFRSIALRTTLYELIARQLESRGSAEPSRTALDDLYWLMHESPPISDAGSGARARDVRVAEILVGLERDG